MVSSDVLARAVGHPTRVRIVAALDEGPCGLAALSTRVGADRKAVAAHARTLVQAGLVRSTRTGRTTTYELVSQPAFSDAEYEVLPLAAREAAVAAALANAHTTAAASLETGGFDRPDVHLSRTSLELGEEQWQALSAEFAALLDRIEAMQADGPSEQDTAMQASAVLMLFERHDGAETHGPVTAPQTTRFCEDEGLDRSWALSEALEQELGAPETNWAAVVALTDQLRVLARSALATEQRERAAGIPVATELA